MLKQRPIAVLAEDEEMIRAVVAPMLDTLGFEVLESDSAEAALRHLEALGGAALLYTDVNMPGRIDGCDLARTTTERWPETKIIVCSGCLPAEAVRLPECAHFIAKPCAERLVRQALKVLRLH